MNAWLAAGLEYEAFWRLTLGEVAVVLRGRRAWVREQLEQQRWANYELAALMSYAMHKPRDMPRYKRLDAGSDLDREPTEADNAKIRAFFMNMARARSGGGK